MADEQKKGSFFSDLFAPVGGFGVTFSTMFRKVVTEEYPEEKRPTQPRFHGRHQLNRHPDGLEKCVGCELCAWACPADAILVEGADNDDTEGGAGRFSPGERYGRVYQINYLRCIFCGLCIEACPTRALTMTNVYELADNNRADLIYTKDQLLAPLQQGMLPPPFPMADGMEERDYYLGKVSSPTGLPARVRRGPHPHRRRGGDLVTGTGEQVLFWVLGPLAVLASLGLLFARKAVHAALGVALTMIILGVFYIAQDADFLGVIQIFVYTGAVMMLFLFVRHARRRRLLRQPRGDDRRPALGDRRAVPRPRRHPRRGDRADQRRRARSAWRRSTPQVGNVIRRRAADLRPLRLGLRDHERAAHHRGARRDGARPPRAPRQGPRPARVEQAPLPRGQEPRRPAGPGRLRPAQRRRHPGPAARRHAVRAVGLAGAHRA